MLASERANSDHMMSARASPHTVATLNAMPPSLLLSLATTHHFSSISHIFSTSVMGFARATLPQEGIERKTPKSTKSAPKAKLQPNSEDKDSTT